VTEYALCLEKQCTPINDIIALCPELPEYAAVFFNFSLYHHAQDPRKIRHNASSTLTLLLLLQSNIHHKFSDDFYNDVFFKATLAPAFILTQLIQRGLETKQQEHGIVFFFRRGN